jgi:hypothetical protein
VPFGIRFRHLTGELVSSVAPLLRDKIAAEGIVRLHVNWLLLCRNCGAWRTVAARVRSWIDNH